METISIGGQEYVADKFGVINVPDDIGEALITREDGFVATTERPPPPVRGA